jgi:hypothetical protein
MGARRWGAVVAAAALAAGCGDGIAGGDYQGDPLVTLRGNVMGSADLVDTAHPSVRIAVFFSPGGPRVTDLNAYVEQPATARVAEVPFSFTINVFDPPGPEHLYTVPGTSTSYAIGQLLAYSDRNANNKRDSDEPIIGVTAARAILYTAQPLPAEVSPTGRLLPAGYSLVSLPLACMPAAPTQSAPAGGPGCMASLSQPCSTDADCGVGKCTKFFMDPWPQGGCVLPDPPPPGCPPASAVRVVDMRPPMSGMTMGPPMGTAYWVAGCNSNDDCGRDGPPYQCDMSVRGCLPTALTLVTLDNSPQVAPYCQGP